MYLTAFTAILAGECRRVCRWCTVARPNPTASVEMPTNCHRGRKQLRPSFASRLLVVSARHSLPTCTEHRDASPPLPHRIPTLETRGLTPRSVAEPEPQRAEASNTGVQSLQTPSINQSPWWPSNLTKLLLHFGTFELLQGFDLHLGQASRFACQQRPA